MYIVFGLPISFTKCRVCEAVLSNTIFVTATANNELLFVIVPEKYRVQVVKFTAATTAIGGVCVVIIPFI